MPTYFLRCEPCDETIRRRFTLLLSEVPERSPLRTCERCSGPLKRVARPPTTQVKESLDNGAMTKRVERYSTAEELYRERARNDPQKK